MPITSQLMNEIDNAIEVQFEEDEFTVISACRERTGNQKGDWSIYSVVVVETMEKKKGTGRKKTASKKSESRLPVLKARSRNASRERRMSPIQQRRYSALDRYRSLPPGTTSIDISTSFIRESSVSVRRRSSDEGQALPGVTGLKDELGSSSGESRIGTFKRDRSLVQLRRQMSYRTQERNNIAVDGALLCKGRALVSRFLQSVPE